MGYHVLIPHTTLSHEKLFREEPEPCRALEGFEVGGKEMEMGLIAEQLVIGIPPLCTRQRGLAELDGSLDRDSSGTGYCNRSSSLRTVVLKMHSSDPGE